MKRITGLAKNWYESIVEPFELIKDNFGSLVTYEVLFRFISMILIL